MWETKFDSSINQVYYVNSLDGTVSFDLPCEVQSKTPRKFCEFRPNLLSRITSKLSLHKTKLKEEKGKTHENRENQDGSDDLSGAPADSITSHSLLAANYLNMTAHMPLSSEDDYMLDEPLNLYNSEYNSDTSSISSSESIQSFYLELLPNAIYFDYEQSVYYDDKSVVDDFDKEQERLELRMQFLKELY